MVYHLLMDGSDTEQRAELDSFLLAPVEARKAAAERAFLADINQGRR